MSGRQRYIKQGVLTVLPLFVPVIPFALAFGIAVDVAGIAPLLGWSSTPLMFGGAAQITLLTLLGEGASMAAAVTAALIVGARHLLYSVTMAPYFRHQPQWFRWVGPFMLIDQVFALAMLRSDREPDSFRRYYVTTMLLFGTTWNVAVPLGMVVGPVIPEAWRLDFAPVIMFAGVALFAIKRVPAGIAALVGGFVSLLAAGLSDRLGILVGAICGVVAGAVAEQRITALKSRSEADL